MDKTELLLLATFGAIVTYYGTKIFRLFAINNMLLDIPNHRSSHSLPTPSAGGTVFATIIQIVVATLWLSGNLPDEQALALLIGGTLLGAFSFIDDRKHLSKRWRFSVHLLSAITALTLLPATTWPLPVQLQIKPDMLDTTYYLLTGFALLWLINLFNFMDGIDGLAITEAISVLTSASLLLWLNHEPYVLTLCLALPLLGFALLNFPPAKIFMGDTGSTFLGYLLGATGLITASQSSLNLWCWAILLGTFIIDATYTLAVRVLTGQQWREAHRSHCYQILSRKFTSHKTIALGNIAINALWLLPLAALSQKQPQYGVYFCITAFLPLLVLTAASGSGKEERPN